MIAQLAPYIGYLASVLLMVGLLVNSDVKFRWYNGLGCLAFVVYAVIIGAMPVLVTNIVLLAINIVWLVKIYRRKELFTICAFNSDEQFPGGLIDFYRNDIETYFPGFKPVDLQHSANFLVLRNMQVANIFGAMLNAHGEAQVVLNYTLPKYRDYKIGHFLFNSSTGALKEKGITKVVYDKVAKPSHAEFLTRSGFVKQGEGYLKIL